MFDDIILSQIQELKTLDLKNNLSLASTNPREVLLHSILKYSTDETDCNYIDAPLEWLEAAYPDASLYGPHFRDITNIFTPLESLDPFDEKIFQFKEKFNLGYGNRHKFYYSAQNLATAHAFRKTDAFAQTKPYKETKGRYGSDLSNMLLMIGAALTVRDLIFPVAMNSVSNKFNKENYLYLVRPWRKVFGELTKADEEHGYELTSDIVFDMSSKWK